MAYGSNNGELEWFSKGLTDHSPLCEPMVPRPLPFTLYSCICEGLINLDPDDSRYCGVAPDVGSNACHDGFRAEYICIRINSWYWLTKTYRKTTSVGKKNKVPEQVCL